MANRFDMMQKKAVDLLEKIKEHPHYLTVPAGIAGGVALSRSLSDAGDATPVKQLIGGTIGGGVGAVLGQALKPEMKMSDMPPAKWADRTRNSVTPAIAAIGGGLKDVLWDMWGGVGKGVITLATSLLLWKKLAPPGTAASLAKRVTSMLPKRTP